MNDGQKVEWKQIAESAEFKALCLHKRKVIIPATIFFMLYFLALPVLVAFCPDLMKHKVGYVNIAYLFALSQFFVAWLLAFLYVYESRKFDKQSQHIIEKFHSSLGAK